MTIQLNADNNLRIKEGYADTLKSLLADELSRFDEHITRLEVHLSDDNGSKDAVNDKRCMIEARLKGRQPIAVTETGNTYDQAVSGAIDKLKNSVDSIIGRMQSH